MKSKIPPKDGCPGKGLVSRFMPSAARFFRLDRNDAPKRRSRVQEAARRQQERKERKEQ